MATTKADKLVREILAGEYDGHLMALGDALGERSSSDSVRFGWRIMFDDLNVGERDLTLDEAIKVEAATLTSWTEIAPLTSAHHCSALLKVLLMSRQGKTEAEVDERFKRVTVPTVLAAIKLEDVDAIPFDSAPAVG